jgi:hypothetical protein
MPMTPRGPRRRPQPDRSARALLLATGRVLPNCANSDVNSSPFESYREPVIGGQTAEGLRAEVYIN